MMRTWLDGDVKAALSSKGTCQEEIRASMRNLTATICLTIAILLGSGGIGYSDILKAGKAADESFKAGAVAYDKRDYATALREWKQLAEQEHGVPQDIVYAHMWFNIAASSGNGYASENRDRLGKLMSRSQLEKAQDLARECVRRNFKGC